MAFMLEEDMFGPHGERELHRRFAHLRVKREWFRDHRSIRAYIAERKKAGKVFTLVA